MSSLSVKITNLMLLNNIASEAELASCIRVSQATLKRALSQKTYGFNQSILEKIAGFFNVSVDHLLSDNPVEKIYIPEFERHHKSPSSILRYLINDIGPISEGELSRRTGVPQPTIHRILSGLTPNPRIESIEPLAEFFNISTDQMLGRVPLSKDRIPGSFVATLETKKIVPLLDWKEIAAWPEIINNYNFKTGREWFSSESGIKGAAFALKIVNQLYLPEFRNGTVIIVDYSRAPKEGDFVIGLLENKTAIVGRYTITKTELKSMSCLYSDAEYYFGKTAQFCGVLAEAKHSF